MGRGSTPQTTAPRPTRVVALTRHASLEVTLAYIARTGQWEVQTVADVEEALTVPADVAVVALETAEASREAMVRLREATGFPPCLVVAEQELPEEADGSKPDAVLLRPFTLEELMVSVEALVPAQAAVPEAPQVPAAPVSQARRPKAPRPVRPPAPAGDAAARREPKPSRAATPPAGPKVRAASPAAPPAPAPAGMWEWSFDPAAAARAAKPTRAVAATPRRPPAPGKPAKTRRGGAPAIDRDWPTEGPLARRVRPLGS